MARDDPPRGRPIAGLTNAYTRGVPAWWLFLDDGTDQIVSTTPIYAADLAGAIDAYRHRTGRDPPPGTSLRRTGGGVPQR